MAVVTRPRKYRNCPAPAVLHVADLRPAPPVTERFLWIDCNLSPYHAGSGRRQGLKTVRSAPGDGERNRALSSASRTRWSGAARPLLAGAAALLCLAAAAPEAGAAEASTGPQAQKQAQKQPQKQDWQRNGKRDWQKGRPRGDAPGGTKPGWGANRGGKPGSPDRQDKRRRAGGGSGPGRQGRPGGAGGRPPMFVGVDRVLKGPLTQTEPVIGRIVATRKGVVAARVSGSVVAIDVAIGDRVKRGQVLARQDTSSTEARLAYESAELKLAEQELKRFEALRTNRSAAFARSRYDTAVHRVARARANVRLVRLAIEGAIVTAPYDGVVVRKATELGAYLKDGAAVVELLNDTEVEVEADVPADRLRGLRPGTIVTFRLRDGGVPRQARVRTVLPMQNALTRTQAVRFLPLGAAPQGRLSINQSLTVDVPVGAARVAVSVHKDAIVNRGDRRLVFVVKGGRAVPRTVELGAAIGTRFVVLAGLAPGDVTVVRGNERLRPGQPVRHRPLMGTAANTRPGNRSPAERPPAN